MVRSPYSSNRNYEGLIWTGHFWGRAERGKGSPSCAEVLHSTIAGNIQTQQFHAYQRNSRTLTITLSSPQLSSEIEEEAIAPTKFSCTVFEECGMV